MPRHPIERAPTDVTAFVGVADGEAALVTDWAAFRQRWPAGGALSATVETFFLAGGRAAWVAPVRALSAASATSAIEGLHDDVALVAVVADPPPAADVLAAVAAALRPRRAMLLVEAPGTDAAAVDAAMAPGARAALGVEGADAAAFWPRLRRVVGGGVEVISPLGSVAGAVVANDLWSGVWSATSGSRGELPAGLAPAGDAARPLRDALAERMVNVIAAFPGRGTQVWGARTLSPDRDWRYIPVRRLALLIEQSVSRALTWTVFEPNGEPLWAAVREDVAGFLHGLWRDSAFAGASASEGYFVKCDRSTITDADIAAGRLVCAIGFAPIRAGEFVVLQVTMTAQGAEG